MPAPLFISDLHLCPTRPQITELFSRFLEGAPRDADTLYILGDLFEYWVGDDDCDDPFNATIITALRRLSDSGTKIFLMHGNRDFLLGEQFCLAAGVSLLGDPTLINLYGTPTLLMHGDTLCTDDMAYQAFRKQVRDPAWQQQFLAQPLAQRKAIAQNYRRKSETAKQTKTRGIMDVTLATLETILRKYNYPRLIHGHTHRPARHLHHVDAHHCERVVLTDWNERGGYLRCDETDCHAIIV